MQITIGCHLVSHWKFELNELSEMATTGESKSENEEFLGFDEEAQVAVFQPREEEYLPSVLELLLL